MCVRTHTHTFSILLHSTEEEPSYRCAWWGCPVWRWRRKRLQADMRAFISPQSSELCTHTHTRMHIYLIYNIIPITHTTNYRPYIHCIEYLRLFSLMCSHCAMLTIHTLALGPPTNPTTHATMSTIQALSIIYGFLSKCTRVLC